MRECTSISKRILLQTLATCSLLLIAAGARAADVTTKKDRSLPPEEEDFSNTPFTEYGSFNEEEQEAEEEAFFQNGRLFGVSLGTGVEGATGNRGQLWQGGFPLAELKVHYWFDFHLAMDLGVTIAQHNYNGTTASEEGVVTVNTSRVFLDVKYYFDVKNLSAPISFANPYILLGIGSFSKSESGQNTPGTVSGDTAMAINGGFGMEFVVKPKKVFFEVEGKLISATFKDTNTSAFQPTLTNLAGMFYTITGGLLFAW